MAYQIASLIGAVLVLVAYGAHQRGIMGRESRLYNAINAIGAALLTWVALADRRWGFVLLEGAWTILSIIPLLRPPHAER